VLLTDDFCADRVANAIKTVLAKECDVGTRRVRNRSNRSRLIPCIQASVWLLISI
jgi:hypothetical protein